MTISYQEEFSSLMLRWRGSLWKAVLKDLIAFYLAYYVILFFQWYVLDAKQKEYFTGWIAWCEIGSQYIPLSFLLGFFVAVVVARWWEQFNWISWPDKMMIMVAACLPGEENLAIRKTIARWSSLQAAIAWSGVSVRTLKRFPTERHLVESNLMTEEEYSMYMAIDAPHGKWFVPTMWIVNLIKTVYRQKRIDSVQMHMLLQHVYSYRDGFAMLFVYDWVKIPLVYTQVVAIATYGYFFICLIGRQPKLDERSMEKETTILFPIFTTFQILFYLGWLKVGQYLMNPFGEDDDDFELNYVLDRNTCIANMMATELADQLPTISQNNLNMVLPHTRASFKIQDVIPKSHLSSFKLSKNEMEVIKPEELEETEALLHDRNEKRTTQRQRLGVLVRAIDSKRREQKNSNEITTEEDNHHT
uniref:Bestrophin homolog n=1 Tax=Ascaris suum TaxID=6253 RepID=F1L7E8_ASCSU